MWCITYCIRNSGEGETVLEAERWSISPTQSLGYLSVNHEAPHAGLFDKVCLNGGCVCFLCL
ncbi:hypothetical protein E2C01_039716 [Portunus trituberculatus]|uniref:Uncharacterized protein n=1 Tax=Portunus trituberculatus TaxID=210409 RepID=A0A5B7FLG8_PORTR|nr:hypothetical protein [Portunus trituberculatus]